MMVVLGRHPRMVVRVWRVPRGTLRVNRVSVCTVALRGDLPWHRRIERCDGRRLWGRRYHLLPSVLLLLLFQISPVKKYYSI